MLSRQFHRHLMVATDADLAAEIRLTTDAEAHAALTFAIRQREDYHRAIDLLGGIQ